MAIVVAIEDQSDGVIGEVGDPSKGVIFTVGNGDLMHDLILTTLKVPVVDFDGAHANRTQFKGIHIAPRRLQTDGVSGVEEVFDRDIQIAIKVAHIIGHRQGAGLGSLKL